MNTTAATVRKIAVRFPKDDVDRMMSLLKSTDLPAGPPYDNADWGDGIDLYWLKKVMVHSLMSSSWLTEFLSR